MKNNLTGNEFEKIVKNILEEYLKEKLEKQKKIEIGYSIKKEHKFDLGNENYIIECKSYEWTKNKNNPSGKISTLRETILYFSLVPKSYKKILVLKKSSLKNNETIFDYFIRLNSHLIPEDLILLEIDIENNEVVTKSLNLTKELKKDKIKKKKKTDNPNIEEVRKYIIEQLDNFKKMGIKEIELVSGNIINEMKIINAAPTVCSAMRSCGYEYEEIYSPPKGNGTRLKLRYKL